MQDTTRQLKQVRSRARKLLAAQRLLQFVAAAVVVVLLLSGLDWLLNLPGWLRLMIGLLVLGESVFWLTTRLLRAARFNPSLSELALRMERMRPELAGVLASSVEFSIDAAGSGRSRDFADLAVSRARGLLDGVGMIGLINPAHTMRCLGLALLAAVVLSAGVLSAPGFSNTALMRWVSPLGATQWPRTVSIQDTTGLTVCPIDVPIRLTAKIHRGHRKGMRVVVHYRLTDALGDEGTWRRALMTQQSTDPGGQAAASFERLIELPALTNRSARDNPGGRGVLTYYLEAGDDKTQPAKVALVARPAVVSVTVTLNPPVYAAGLVGSQTSTMHEQSGQVVSVSALVGSTVTLRLDFNKPIAIQRDNLHEVLPGLVETVGSEFIELVSQDESGGTISDQFTLRFRLQKTFETPVHLIDEHGLSNLSKRRYQIEATVDSPPSVVLTNPAGDETVLATARVRVSASARDDVGLEEITLNALTRKRTPGSVNESADESLPTLSTRTGRQASLSTQTDMELEPLKLSTGDLVMLSAKAVDVYEIDGERHDPVESALRTLRIIDEPTMVAQMRTELAGLRQQVVRLEQTQKRIETEKPPSVTLPQQAQITRRLEAQGSLLNSLEQRIQRNRLEDQPMREMIRRAGVLVEGARKRSSDAASRLRQAVEAPEKTDELEAQAHVDQQAVRETLTELAELLDQGSDVLTLKLQLQQLKAQQQSLANDTREMFPETIGQDRDQLEAQQKRRLDELAKRQDELSQQAGALTRQMQATAEVLSRQGERDQDRAAAEALAEAAAIGQRQGLGESMQQSSESIQDNQLSQAGQQQDKAMDAIEKMLDEMGTQERRRQAILRRRLRELSGLIRKLLERQLAQTQTLTEINPDGVLALAPDQTALRRATMGAQQRAGGSPQTQKIESSLGEAVREQGTAVGALRLAERLPALTAQRAAAEYLRAAIKDLDKAVKDDAQKQARKQREKLREAYEQHARDQDELLAKVSEIEAAGPVDRRRRAGLVALSAEQSALQQAIAETGELIEQTLVFEYLHSSIGSSSSRVVSALRRGVGDETVRLDQRSISSMLRVMAEALKEDKSDDPFAGEQGGGGGGGAEPPLVPPLAELKLLRGVQQVIYEQTRLAGESLSRPADGPMKQRMLELSTRQRELSSLGRRLIDRMKKRSPPGSPGSPKAPDAPDDPAGETP